MKFYTSYFYQIRNFNKYIIPVSTAVYDPKWFHNFKDKYNIWIDSNGVYNGIRFEELNPESCKAEGCPCDHQKDYIGFQTCNFLKSYREGLNKLDFDKLLRKCDSLVQKIQNLEDTDEEFSIAFIFHESPDNPCSERVPVIELFRSHDIEISEF